MTYWDPIGVAGIPAASDEYDTQVMAIAGWLHRARPSFADLRKYLDDEAYSLSRTWDDDDALDRTTTLLLELDISI